MFQNVHQTLTGLQEAGRAVLCARHIRLHDAARRGLRALPNRESRSRTTRLVFAAGLAFALGVALLSAMAQPGAAPAPASMTPYFWRNVVIGGGGFVTGIITHPRQKDLFYARTNVGGAYRWDAGMRRWIPLTDWIGSEDANLTGVESLAVDASDARYVYLAVGTYSVGPAAVLRSADQGRTFQRTDLPITMGANELGRFNGERLAVDPNLGTILFFGSRRDGLWKSADRGVTWAKVESFPSVETRESLSAAGSSRPWFPQSVGIVCVLFAPGDAGVAAPAARPTPTIYVAVSTTGTNLYRSTDAGVSWEPVPKQPVGLRPNHMVFATDGMLYLTYGQEPGPFTMNDGAVWKYSPRNGVWTDITPLKPADADQPFGYGAVAVDARHPRSVMVSTFAHWKPLDEIFRSTNAGATWMPVLAQAAWDHSAAPYTEGRKPHWLGSLQIDPFNSDQVLFVTGYGIWSCADATQTDCRRPTHWMFLDYGIEETVPLALLSPPEGAHLLSGLGDVDGFVHRDLAVSPPDGTFAGPRFSNTEDLAVAGRNPLIIVRTGTSHEAIVHAAVSFDGGSHWRPLASEPPRSAGAGSITISADAQTIVWTPRGSAPHYTTDLGRHWTACENLQPGNRVEADTVNPGRFYAFDERAGRLLVSSNGAADFEPAAALTAPTGKRGAPGRAVSVTPGAEDDVWVALRNEGLFHSTNGGASFMKLENVQEAASLGFGKAAPLHEFPALYLAGKIAGVKALYRSSDAGETWTRINDDQHQYGYISQVIGDPRIYGRVYAGTGGRGIVYGDPAPEDKTVFNNSSLQQPANPQ